MPQNTLDPLVHAAAQHLTEAGPHPLDGVIQQMSSSVRGWPWEDTLQVGIAALHIASRQAQTLRDSATATRLDKICRTLENMMD